MGETGYFRRLYEAAAEGYHTEEWGETALPTELEEIFYATGYCCGGVRNLFRAGSGLSIYSQHGPSEDLGSEEEPADGIDAVVKDTPDKPLDT